jgi:hypothetical protein
LTSPSHFSQEGKIFVNANVLFENSISAVLPDNWHLLVLFNGNELRRLSDATVNFWVLVHDQQWVTITVCLVDSTARSVSCDRATTLCIPTSLSSLPRKAAAGDTSVHIGTIGFHALTALPYQVEHVLAVSFHEGFTIVAALCDSRLCISSTHNAVSGIWSLHYVGSFITIPDSTEYMPSSIASFHNLEHCVIFRLGISYFRITFSDLSIDFILQLPHFPASMHILTCNIKSQCCFFIGSTIEVIRTSMSCLPVIPIYLLSTPLIPFLDHV